jgi:hypothetical protein
MTWSHTKSFHRVELVLEGLCGQRTLFVRPRVSVEFQGRMVFLQTKMVYTFERMTLNRATTCVEFAFSKLAREMFFVTMEYVNDKVCIFFTVAM